MDWTAVAPLIGVALGALIPLVGVVLNTRTTQAQARAQWLSELRAERKASILEFLRQAQECENLLSKVWRRAPDLPTGKDLLQESSRINSEVWLAQRKILLVASEQLRVASEAYARRLDDAMYGVDDTTDHSIWDFVREYRNNFLEAARKELGVDAGPPV